MYPITKAVQILCPLHISTSSHSLSPPHSTPEAATENITITNKPLEIFLCCNMSSLHGIQLSPATTANGKKIKPNITRLSPNAMLLYAWKICLSAF